MKTTSSTAPARREPPPGTAPGTAAAVRRAPTSSAGRGNQVSPSSAPPAMIATCASAPDHTSAAIAATSATVIRGASGVSLVAIPHTACATTATATILRPRSQRRTLDVADGLEAEGEARRARSPTAA